MNLSVCHGCKQRGRDGSEPELEERMRGGEERKGWGSASRIDARVREEVREGGRQRQLVSFRHFVSIHPGERILGKCHQSDQEWRRKTRDAEGFAGKLQTRCHASSL